MSDKNPVIEAFNAGLGCLGGAGLLWVLFAVLCWAALTLFEKEKKPQPMEFSVMPTKNPWAEQFGDDEPPMLKYTLSENALSCSLEIYDAKGGKVRTLVFDNSTGNYGAMGWHVISWNGRDESGKLLKSGEYSYRFSTLPLADGKSFAQGGKLVLTRQFVQKNSFDRHP